MLRLGSAADLVEAFTRGDVQALWLRPAGDEVARVESAAPDERRRVIATPASVQLVFNTRAGPIAVAEVRRAIAAALDPTDLAADPGRGLDRRRPGRDVAGSAARAAGRRRQ